jgi:predicted TIM-barrel fold metal-dependent hydrolase
MERRTFLSTAALGLATAPAWRPTVMAAQAPRAGGLIDTNVYVSPWVVRDSAPGTPAQVVEKLIRHGVTSAWAGSFEGALHTDIAGVNARLAEACARDGAGVLRPFGTINPAFPDWEEDLRRCHEVHRMAGVRLFPSYHGYALQDPRFARLLDLAARRRLLVQIVFSIEDERSQNPVVSAGPAQVDPLAEVLEKIPSARVMLLNTGARVLGPTNRVLGRLVTAGVAFEIALLEGVAGIESLLQRVPALRLSFGSHAPYFYFEAALLKLQESALSREQLGAVMHGNAASLIA